MSQQLQHHSQNIEATSRMKLSTHFYYSLCRNTVIALCTQLLKTRMCSFRWIWGPWMNGEFACLCLNMILCPCYLPERKLNRNSFNFYFISNWQWAEAVCNQIQANIIRFSSQTISYSKKREKNISIVCLSLLLCSLTYLFSIYGWESNQMSEDGLCHSTTLQPKREARARTHACISYHRSDACHNNVQLKLTFLSFASIRVCSSVPISCFSNCIQRPFFSPVRNPHHFIKCQINIWKFILMFPFQAFRYLACFFAVRVNIRQRLCSRWTSGEKRNKTRFQCGMGCSAGYEEVIWHWFGFGNNRSPYPATTPTEYAIGWNLNKYYIVAFHVVFVFLLTLALLDFLKHKG